MSKELLFWVIYIISVLVGGWSLYEPGQSALWYKRAGGYFILWVLVGLLGWAVFGAAIR